MEAWKHTLMLYLFSGQGLGHNNGNGPITLCMSHWPAGKNSYRWNTWVIL